MVKNGKSAPATELREKSVEASEMTMQLNVRKARNRRRKGWEMRRMKSAETAVDLGKEEAVKKDLEVIKVDQPTEISLSFPASCSSDQSSENDAVVAEKPDNGDEAGENSDAVAEMMTTSHGFVSIIGRRREMEDAVTVQTRFVDSILIDNNRENGVNFDFFAVYDGHGGSHVAQFCHEQLHQVVANEVREEMFGGAQCKLLNWKKVMAGSFGKMDDQINSAETQESMKTIGSTAVVAVVGEEQLIVANCGDSRAVICRGGVAVALSTDHKPDRPDELERVEAAGGRVINWNGFRVLGVLATSRSIGDQYLKPFVISEPEVTICQRTNNDEFLILASDGLWDVISNEVACQLVRKCLFGRLRKGVQHETVEANGATRAATLLAELAMARGSKDNISVVIVELRKQQ
ncbi:unnamed protein product [Rhodiola kirilowii]